MIKWFDVLLKNNIEIKLSETPAEDAVNESAVDKKTAVSNKQTSAKTTAVKSAPPKKINSPRKMA